MLLTFSTLCAVPLCLAAVAFQSASPDDSFDKLASDAAKARQENRLPQAIELYRSAVAVNPAWSEGWWFLGRLSYDANQYPSAQDAFTHYVSLKEKDGAGWGFLGLCEFETAAYAGALSHIRRAFSLGLEAEPGVKDVLHFHMALLLTRTGLFDQAIAEYSPFVHRGIKPPALVSGLGLAALRRQLLPREIPPDQQELVIASGEIAYLWTDGKADQAEPGFESLLARFPTAPGVHYFRGSYLLTSRPSEAIAEFNRELNINPRCADARAIIALALMRSISDKAALAQAQRASDDGPSTPMAQYVYGLVLTHLDEKQGIDHLETAERLDPENVEYHMALAGVYSKFGHYADARRERAESIALAKENATAPL